MAQARRSWSIGRQPRSGAVTLAAVLALAAVAITLALHAALPQLGSAGRHTGRITASVYATGSASARPGEELIYLYANATAYTGAAAVSNLTSTIDALNSTIEPYLRYNASSITTTSYGLYAPYTQCGQTPAEPLAPNASKAQQTIRYNCSAPRYEAEESLTVRLPNTSETGSVLAALSGVPHVYVNGVYAKLRRQQAAALRAKAYEVALANATAEGEALAKGAHLSLMRISAQQSEYVPAGRYLGISSTQQLGTLPVYLGNITVSVQITARFAYNGT